MNKQIALTIRQVREADYEAFAHFLEENNKPEITKNFLVLTDSVVTGESLP